ncbi:MAG: sensor histidine kinase, partial [Anaerolineae bacterium]
HAFDGISVYEELPEQDNRRLIDCNTRYTEMAGRSKEELLALGNTLSIQQDVDAPKDRAEFVERLNQGVYTGRFSWVRPDGRDNVIEYAAVPRHVDDRLLVIGVDHDITAQLRAEAALERERTLLRTLVDTMPAIIFAKDIEGRKILANIGDQNAMGVHSEAAAIGKTDFEIYPPERAAKFAEEDRHVLEDGEIFESESMFVDSHTGQQRWVSGSKRPLRNQAGQIIGLIGSFYDITHIKQAEFEREKLIAELEAKNAELERFTYTVSHDLKSPLITIGGFVGFLQRDLLNGDMTQAQEDMARITAALAKMQQLLDELLELSRIGRRMNLPETVPFEIIAREAVELVRGRITAGDVTVEIMPDLPTVHGDRARLVEVVQNLVDNACKYMGDTSQPHIEIGARQTEAETVFYVRDNGIGIDPQYHEKVFGLFDKIDPASDGDGVGLAIVKRIVEVHGGKIWIESGDQGTGSTFCFTLSDGTSGMNYGG